MEQKDITIVALTTQITNIEKNISAGVASLTTKFGAAPSANPHWGSKFTLEDWRIVFDGKEKVIDDRTWYWCPHHKMDGFYDGMHVDHTWDTYDE